MSTEPKLRELADWVDQQATRVLEVGSTCALGGDAAWDAVLRDHGVEPMPDAERKKHIAEGAKRTRGALPIEVRWVANSMYERGRASVRALDLKSDTPEENAIVSKIEHRLSNLVDEITRAHLQRVGTGATATGGAPTTSSIFANARATTPNYVGQGVKAGMNQMKCVSCGAPRKNESEALTCVYCGGKLA